MKHYWLGLLVLVPLVGSTWSSLQPAHARYGSSDSVDPLAMHIHLVHMREIDLREGRAIAEFSFHNAGQEAFRITRIKPSCGCVSVRMRKDETIEPEQSGRFYVEVDTAGETAGQHEYDIDVFYQMKTEAEPRQKQVRFRVDVPDKKVTVKPRALIFYQLSEQPTTQRVTLTDFRGGANFDLLEAHCRQDLIKIGSHQLGEDDHGNRQVSFEVTVTGPPSQYKITDHLRLTTNDDEFPEIKIPLLIYGPKPQPSQSTSSSPATKQ